MGKFGIAIVDLAKGASSFVGDLAEGAAGAASDFASGATQVAGSLAKNAQDTAVGVAGKVNDGIQVIKDSSKEHAAFEAKKTGFKDGLNEGASLMAEKLLTRTYALFALGLCMARCDGELSEEELREIRADVEHVLANGNVPQAVRMDLYAVANNDELGFDDALAFLDKLDCKTLFGLHDEIRAIAEADGEVSPEEEELLGRYESYVRSRVDADEEAAMDVLDARACEEAPDGR